MKSSMDSPLIQARQLTVRYPFQQRDSLKDVDLHIASGERVLILGPSGGGKSTLALAINGIIPRSIEAEVSGEMTVDGVPSRDAGPAQMCRKIGILFQDTETQFCMTTVEDEIAFGLENMALPAAEMESRIVESLRLTGLADRRYARQQELSGGLKQKLGLACLLAMDPEVLILDEPTANLDPATTDDMFALLARIAEQSGKTLIFIEHKLDDLLVYIDRVIVLGDAGSVIADGQTRHIFQHEIDKLLEQGIWVPRLCLAANQLEQQGMVWEKFPLSLAEWEEGLLHGLEKLGQHAEAASVVIAVPAVCAALAGISSSAVKTAASTKPPLLEIREVSFSYGRNHLKDSVNVLHSTSFSITQGEFTALLGPNGTGKSTLAQLMIKLLSPKTGQILLHGTPIEKLKVQQLMRKIGFVFQNPEHQFIRDTVEEELSYGLLLSGYTRHSLRPRLDELLQRFRLTEQRKQNPFSLSQGQKRRLSVAAMLTSEQELLILDEPTFGQDYANTIALMELLRDLHQEGKSIVMVTHDMELVKQYASRVLLLHEGHLIYDGLPQSLFNDEHMMRRASIKRPLTDELEQGSRIFMEAMQHARTLAEA
ncbi:ABC transporter ATP-binding protein [Paenibacillus eucommiae]|uniref:Energy-coupling factor transport system ATP-binding protein n=1 Tax=Paenibacillus eucommiae TaxID=1355755 RepID=A0ABS4J070_9BACL|nr:energy-coupling factor transporter ATPase [Paenibacillus eucommiae]MBP1992174.1 energy-coupling factor transport system ATP-binding protein [Paenibacillus eucommiae]